MKMGCYRILRKLQSVLLLSILIFSLAEASSGLITVVPTNEYVPVGSNATVYCTINRTMTSDTSANLIWSHGYPPFTSFGKSIPGRALNITRIINESTMSITLLNVQTDDSEYYYCYLRGTRNLDDADHCDIHVIERPKESLENLTCGAASLSWFYCSWEDQTSSKYSEDYNATFTVPNDRKDHVRQMTDCGDWPTPGVPPDYIRRCAENGNGFDVIVTVEVSNPVGISSTERPFHVLHALTPLPIDNLRVLDKQATSIRVTGGPPPHFNVLDPINILHLSKYEISYATTTGGEWQIREINHNELDYPLDKLYPNTDYNVRARSQAQNNWSHWSANTSFKTLDSKPTGRITDLHFDDTVEHDNKYNRTITIVWTGLNKHQEGADSFVYYLDLIETAIDQIVISATTKATRYTFLTISRFLKYYIRITPGNHIGNGTLAMRTVRDLSGEPGQPSQLMWRPLNTTAGSLVWDDPVEPNSIIVKFIVRWQELNQHGQDTQLHSTELMKRTGDEDFSLIVTELETYEMYEFSVCAVSQATGQCGEEAKIEGLTHQGAPENPPVGFAAIADPSGNALLLQWSRPPGDHNGDIVRYVIRYCSIQQEEHDCLSGDSVQTYDYTPHSAKLIECTLRGLGPYTDYQLTVAAFSGEMGPPSDVARVKTAQSTANPPGNLQITSVNSTLIRVMWDAPTDMRGILDHYTVSCEDCKPPRRVTVRTTSAHLEVYGNTKVNVGVQACTQATVHPCSTVVLQMFLTAIGGPSIPMYIHVTDISEDKIALKWERPQHPNGPIVHYNVLFRKSTDRHWQQYKTVTDKNVTVKVDCNIGIENVYDVAVQAVTRNGSVFYPGEIAQVDDYELCAALNTWNTYVMIMLASVAFLVIVVCLIIFILYHQRVKKNLPDPYFIDSVKSSIYGQRTWPYNESQFFIIERESFDTLRCVDDSTQLLGLDRMYSTEGSTSSSDQGIHDMDGQLTGTNSCTRLVSLDSKGEVKRDFKQPLRVLCEHFDKDPALPGDDAVFPDDTDNYGPSDSVTASMSYSSPIRRGTPLNSPASLTASDYCSERVDSGTASYSYSEPTKYAKLTDAQLSPTSTIDNSSRPLSSASEDSISYTRIGENNNVSPKLSQELPRVVFDTPITPNIDPKGLMGPCLATKEVGPLNGPNQMSSGGDGPQRLPPLNNENTKPRHPSSGSSSDEPDELLGYCKHDLTGLLEPVTSSGVSSLGEEYSRIAEGQASVPADRLPVCSVDDPYVTDQQMNEGRLQLSDGATPLEDLSPTIESSLQYTSPYVTSEHAV